MSSDLTAQTFVDFPAAFKGATLRPGDDGYGASRQLWNMRRSGDTPALIVQPLDPDDIVTAVQYAREQGAAVAIRGGGHGVDGLAMPDGALVIDMSKLKDVSVDPATGHATIGAGVLLGEMDAATQKYGLAIPAGVVSDTGATGLALGGGIGHLTRRFGATVDNLLSIDVVTTDGRELTASADSNPDLFWGMRGAGHNLAIATSLTFQAQKVGPEVMSGVVIYAPDEAVKLCAGIDALMRKAPRELSIPLVFTPAPPLPGLPEQLIGQPLLIAVVIYVGALDEYEAAISEVLALATPMANMVRPTLWTEANSLVDPFQPIGRRYQSGGSYVPGMSAELAQAALARVAAQPAPPGPASGCLVSFPMLGGAMLDGDEDECVFSRQGAEWVAEIVAMWDTEAGDDGYVGWVADTVDALSPYTVTNGYINLTADRGPDWLRNVYGSAEKWEKLVALKQKWDPDNMLAYNKNVLRATEATPA